MSLAEEPTRPLEVFISYVEEDNNLRHEIKNQLSNLERQKIIEIWDEENISAGEEPAHEIDRHLSTAHIILLLVSPAFVASDHCHSLHVTQAVERYKRGEVQIVPIILRPTYWRDTPFGNLKALPGNGKPITKWKNRDDALLDVAEGIRGVINKVNLNHNTKDIVSKSDDSLPLPQPNSFPNIGSNKLPATLFDRIQTLITPDERVLLTLLFSVLEEELSLQKDHPLETEDQSVVRDVVTNMFITFIEMTRSGEIS